MKFIPNQKLKFAIWDNFVNFSFINKISVRIQAHDINYLMPSKSSTLLTVNMPPLCLQFQSNHNLEMHILQNFNLEYKMPKIQILRFNIVLHIINPKNYTMLILIKDNMII